MIRCASCLWPFALFREFESSSSFWPSVKQAVELPLATDSAFCPRYYDETRIPRDASRLSHKFYSSGSLLETVDPTLLEAICVSSLSQDSTF